MKNILLFKRYIFVIFLLSNCAGIPSNKIKLEKYPELITSDQIRNLDLSYETISFQLTEYQRKFNSDFTYKITSLLEKLLEKNDKHNKLKTSSKCLVKISTTYEDQSYIGAGYQAIATATLFILPYYMPYNYESKATLISTKNNRILKQYALKDKVHEVWSLIWAMSWFIYEPKFAKTPEGAKRITEHNISEALVRQILNDASTFEECKK